MDVPRSPAAKKNRRLMAGAALLAALGAVTAVLGRLRPAAPAVDRATVWIDTVKRGPLVREILAQGTLAPEEVHFVSAATSARVESVLVRPGAAVEADTVLLVLANPELELAALEAERGLASAEADLVNLRASLEGQRLGLEAQVATLRTELGDARRRAAADEELGSKGFLSELERGQSRAHADELGGRLGLEQRRVQALGRGHAAQVAAQRQQVERQRAIAQVRRREVDNLRVRAGVAGVLQQLPWQVGQTVAPGALLAQVARPDRLKAEVRVPETQAKDVALGLAVTIDTHTAMIAGRVARIDPAVQGGFVKVDVTLAGPLPAGARPDLSVSAVIELERLADVLYVGRPALGGGQPALFQLEPDGDTAVRTPVRLGRASARSIEIVNGLREGDRVILSDMSRWNAADRIRLK